MALSTTAVVLMPPPAVLTSKTKLLELRIMLNDLKYKGSVFAPSHTINTLQRIDLVALSSIVPRGMTSRCCLMSIFLAMVYALSIGGVM